MSAVHLPGVLNFKADRVNKYFNDATEWMLHKPLKAIADTFPADEDLFTSSPIL